MFATTTSLQNGSAQILLEYWGKGRKGRGCFFLTLLFRSLSVEAFVSLRLLVLYYIHDLVESLLKDIWPLSFYCQCGNPSSRLNV